MDHNPKGLHVLDLPLVGSELFKAVVDNDSAMLSFRGQGEDQGAFLVARFSPIVYHRGYRFGVVREVDTQPKSPEIDDAIENLRAADERPEHLHGFEFTQLNLWGEDAPLLILVYHRFELIHNNLSSFAG